MILIMRIILIFLMLELDQLDLRERCLDVKELVLKTTIEKESESAEST